jgi:hypothetical protein
MDNGDTGVCMTSPLRVLFPEDEGDTGTITLRGPIPFVARLLKYRELSSLCSSLLSELLSGFCTRRGALGALGGIPRD